VQSPRLTFACELDAARLTALVADPTVLTDLQALGARVALMLSDFSPARAAVVRQLTAAGIPVVAIPLVSSEEGYYFTADNAPRAVERYEQWKAWTAEYDLVWDGVGLDIEPDARFYLQIMENPWGLLPMLLPRLLGTAPVRRARAAYSALIDRIRADGRRVENYQFPVLADERWARSTLLQRLLGLVDIKTDREVWMLYTSVFPGIGPGILWSYAPEAPAIGVGSTGGGAGYPRPSAGTSPELGRVLAGSAPRPELMRRPARAQPRRLCPAGLPGTAPLLRLATDRGPSGNGKDRGGATPSPARHPLDERASLARRRWDGPPNRAFLATPAQAGSARR
jgi:hypothetical protein